MANRLPPNEWLPKKEFVPPKVGRKVLRGQEGLSVEDVVILQGQRIEELEDVVAELIEEITHLHNMITLMLKDSDEG